jgi:hypothetical protein
MAINTTANNFEITKGGYVAFDATSLRQLILDRLNQQQVFTDQNFIGSNLASIIDIVAYAYNTLIYYLNKTSSESMFTESQLYENINRIVKLIDYNPIGFQTSTLNFQCSATNFLPGLYTIPRYSYVAINNIPYSFNEDITFLKETDGTDFLTEVSRQKLLYQGLYEEYPLYSAIGDNNEIVFLNTTNELVDHFNIDVYVKPKNTDVWEQFTKTVNLYLEDSTAKKYEIRYNNNRRYEIKFGNDINGYKLKPGDLVAFYYLRSQGIEGEVGSQALQTGDSTFTIYNTIQYNEILNDVLKNEFRLVNSQETNNLLFSNNNSSTPVKQPETVEEIKQTSPSLYRTQYRLVTQRDFEQFVRANFANLITEVKAMNNWEYVSTYMKYFYDIGIQEPFKTERALLNQVLYSDACNFNNIYLIVVPRSGTQNFDYLAPAQKELITSFILPNKMATTEVVFVDPVYKAVSFGTRQLEQSTTENFIPALDAENNFLEIRKNVNARQSDQNIINNIVNIFTEYFSRENIKLGQIIDTRQLTQRILDIEGVQAIFTVNNETNIRVEGLSFFLWNPMYPENDVLVTSNNIILQNFEIPYFSNINRLSEQIRIVSSTTVFEAIEY